MSAVETIDLRPDIGSFIEGLHTVDQDVIDMADKFTVVFASQTPIETANDLGLIENIPTWRDGLDANLYLQPRVSAFNRNGVETKQIVKVQTMAELTEEAREFANMMSFGGHACLKRMYGPFVTRPLLRRLSLDELPQVIFNVGDMSRRNMDLLQMNAFGAARPMIPEEISLTGDNSNDAFAHALESLKRGDDTDIWDTYDRYGRIYQTHKPGLITPALAEGHRQLNTTEDFHDMLSGMDRFAYINKLPEPYRKIELARLVIRTAAHVAVGTEAA